MPVSRNSLMKLRAMLRGTRRAWAIGSGQTEKSTRSKNKRLFVL